MLNLFIPDKEYYNEKINKFIYVKECNLQLEHSLISIKKWEQIWHKPFLNTNKEEKKKTAEEIISYIKCMTINTSVDPNIYMSLTNSMIKQIVDYIDDPMTARVFNDKLVGAQKNIRETITAETIYYWMISLNIPIEFQKWHLNSLLALIKYINNKNNPRKMSPKEAAIERDRLNEERLKKYHTKG